MMTRRPTTRLRVTSLEDRLTPAGGLDPTFGAGGIVTTEAGKYSDRPSVLTQPDGHVLVVSDPGGYGTQITRYNADGSLDTDFGSGGTVRNLVPGRTASLNDAAVGPDGKITLSGTAYTAQPQFNTAVVRLNADGSPDAGFGTAGVVTLEWGDVPGLGGPITATAYDLALLADGSVVVTGSDYFRGFTAVRLTPAGAVDPAFGVNGLFSYPTTGPAGLGYDYLLNVTGEAAPDGGVVLMGSQVKLDNLGHSRAVSTVLKLTAAGTLDSSFDGDGVASIASGDSGGGHGLAVQPDGKVLVAVSAGDPLQPSRPSSTQVVRLNADGTPDAGFGGGRVVALPGGGYGGLSNLALLPDGRIVVASGRYGPRDTGVAVLNADGTPDDYFADSTGVGGIDYGATPTSVTAGGVTIVGRGPSVSGLAVSGDRIVVLSSLYNDVATLMQSGTLRVGLAVLTEGPGALPLMPEPPVVETPPELPVVLPQPPYEHEPREYVTTLPGENPLIDLPLIVPPPPGLTDVELAATTGVAPQRVADPIPPPYNLENDFYVLPFGTPGDLNGDGLADKVVTAGSTVSVVSGSDGAVLVKAFAPFEASYTGTLNAVFVDVDGDGKSELVVSPGQGGGPVVAVYGDDGRERGRFWGIADSGFRGGVNLAAGDVDGDGRADLIVTAGQGGGPRVAIFDGTTLGANSKRLVADFFAFEPTQTGGATAVFADDTFVFAAGSGGGPRVRGVYATSLLAGVKSLDELPAAAVRFDKFAGDPASRGGVTLAIRPGTDKPTEFGYYQREVAATGSDGTSEVVMPFDRFRIEPQPRSNG